MILDYMVEMPCEPKQRLGVEALLARLRLLARARHSGARTPEETAAARQALYDLQPLAFHCARCPANASAVEFGCYGCFHEAVSIEAEDWLMDRLPVSLTEKQAESDEEKTQMGWVRRLMERLRAANITGRAVDDRRRCGLAVRPKPLVRSYGSLFRRHRLSASQLLEVVLLRETVEPGLGESLCRALGVWQDGGVGEDGLPEAVFTEPPSDGDDQAVLDLKQFFLAAMTACSLDVPVRTWEPPPVESTSAGPASNGAAGPPAPPPHPGPG